MKSKTKTFGLSILLIFSLLFFPNMGMACFNPTDSFATEVTLNKPSITYDLSEIKHSKDVTLIEKEESLELVEEVHREDVDLALAIDIDLDRIGKVADKGTAGWNSKIRLFKGKWVQGITEEMLEETEMYMVRASIDCGGFPAGLLSLKVPDKVATSYYPSPFMEAWKTGKALVVGVIITIALIVGVVLCGIRIRRGMMKNKNLLCRLFALVGLAFICGIIFQFIQVVVFDTFGIDSFLGFLWCLRWLLCPYLSPRFSLTSIIKIKHTLSELV